MFQAALQRGNDRLRTIMGLEAHQDYTYVAFYSCFGDTERGRNLLVALAVNHQG
jgi:hypothetical protein